MKITYDGKRLVYKHIHMDIFNCVENMSKNSQRSMNLKLYNECVYEDELISIKYDYNLSTKKQNVYQIKKYEYENKNLFEYQIYVDKDTHTVNVSNTPIKLTFKKEYLYNWFHNNVQNDQRLFLKESKFPMKLSKHNIDVDATTNFVDYYRFQ